MEGLDELLVRWGGEGTLLVGLLAALLLGLRHATDPDHLVAVSTLVAGEEERAGRRAASLGAAWGAGHALTVTLLGLPVALAGADVVPEPVRGAAEVLIGVLIAVLAVRLVRRWRTGGFHVHEHRHEHPHGAVVHRHLHAHPSRRRRRGHRTPQRHEHVREHRHEHRRLRSRRQAFGLGLVHGVGGSAAVGVLLVGSLGGRAAATAGLLLFAAGTALAMAAASSGLGLALGRPLVARGLRPLVPALGALSLLFGVWYAAAGIAALS